MLKKIVHVKCTVFHGNFILFLRKGNYFYEWNSQNIVCKNYE